MSRKQQLEGLCPDLEKMFKRLRLIQLGIYGVVTAVIIGLMFFLTAGDARADEADCKKTETNQIVCDIHVGFFEGSARVIKGTKDHAATLEIIRIARKGDVINLYFSGNGGSTTTAMAFMSTMYASKATIVTHIIGPVFSAHAIIPLAGDKIVVDDLAVIMFHQSYMYVPRIGKTRDVAKVCSGEADPESNAQCQSDLTAYFDLTNKFFARFLLLALSEAKYRDYMQGKDVYLLGYELKQGIKRMGKLGE